MKPVSNRFDLPGREFIPGLTDGPLIIVIIIVIIVIMVIVIVVIIVVVVIVVIIVIIIVIVVIIVIPGRAVVDWGGASMGRVGGGAACRAAISLVGALELLVDLLYFGLYLGRLTLNLRCAIIERGLVAGVGSADGLLQVAHPALGSGLGRLKLRQGFFRCLQLL